MCAADESEDLKRQLEKACEDLWWSSESDYPVEVVWQPDVEMEGSAALEEIAQMIDDWVRDRHLEDNIEKVEVDDFFEKALTPRSWHTEEDKAQLAQLQQLKDLLIDNYSTLQAYRCGEVEISAYVLGCGKNAVLSGVQTIIVET